MRLLAFLLLWPYLAFASETATAIAEVVQRVVASITVTRAGSGYVEEPVVSLVGGGGAGAVAKAVLSGDRVERILVLNAGSGYSSPPSVSISAPPAPASLSLELIAKLTLNGTIGRFYFVEWSDSPQGPWTVWTNVGIGPQGVTLLDLNPGSNTRFYRTISNSLTGPPGFVWIPPGNFVMGSPITESGRADREVEHFVVIDHGFFMGDHEVTQGEYQVVVGRNPSGTIGTNLPVESVSWNDAVGYCERLTFQERLAGRISSQQEFRLPTESEWEYAARAGTTAPRYGPIDLIGWYRLNSNRRTNPVKSKAPNQWGLHDMIGNVGEWCSDWYGDYPTVATSNPRGPSTGTSRVYRGVSYDYPELDCRAATRLFATPSGQNSNLGFRVVLAWIR